MEEVYSIKAMFAITAVMIAFMFVCFFTYEYLIIRILVVVAMCVVALMKRKMLMGIFNSLKNK